MRRPMSKPIGVAVHRRRDGRPQPLSGLSQRQTVFGAERIDRRGGLLGGSPTWSGPGGG